MESNYKRKLLFSYGDQDETYRGLRLRALADGVKFKFSKADKISYSTNEGVTWIPVSTASEEFPLINLKANDSIIVKGNFVNCESTSEFNGTFSSTGLYEVSGNIMSLIEGGVDKDGNTVLRDLSNYKYVFYRLFYSSGTADKPKLQDISQLSLPATTLAPYCYSQMFYNNTSISSAPILPATTLVDHCYYRMFYGCEALTTIPVLSAETLAPYCYSYMFYNCKALTTAPALPVTMLADRCYEYMFYGCKALTTAPALPAETLAPYCYSHMFDGCENLTTAPNTLPATTLTSYCYGQMFKNCKALTTAPILPATTLVSNCYYQMFYNCNSLNYINAAFTTTPSASYTSQWVLNVAEYGTFIKNKTANWEVSGPHGVPINWEVSVNYNPFSIDNKGSVNLKVKFKPENLVTITNLQFKIVDTAYLDNSDADWDNDFNAYTEDTYKYLAPGKSIVFKFNILPHIYTNIGSGIDISSTGIGKFYTEFEGTGIHNMSVSGNILSLLFGDNYNTPIDFNEYEDEYGYELSYLFYDLFIYTDITDASALKLIQRNLTGSTYLYGRMFRGCTNLTSTPTLPATTLADHCYSHMFEGCTGLTSAPALPATTLASYCYENMFDSCEGLTTAPALPATTLADHCYSHMFLYCTGLTSAPALPATTLASYCYENMFDSCEGLTTAPALPAITLAPYCYSYMFINCINLVGVPNTNLPAIGPDSTALITFAEGCYERMFSSCSSMIYAPNIIVPNSGILCPSCCEGMFEYCTSLETFDAPTKSIFNYGPGLTFAANCFADMFKWCSLSTFTGYLMNPSATENPLARDCFAGMFAGNLFTEPPVILPTQKLAPGCYRSMFEGCTNLIEAPILPATSLQNHTDYPIKSNNYEQGCYECYASMFKGCKSLIGMKGYTTHRIVLPSVNTASGCYRSMFEGCTSLTRCDILASSIFANDITPDYHYVNFQCYDSMFKGCSKLCHITWFDQYLSGGRKENKLDEYYDATDGLQLNTFMGEWVKGVKQNGIFSKFNTSKLGYGFWQGLGSVNEVWGIPAYNESGNSSNILWKWDVNTDPWGYGPFTPDA